MAEQKKIYNRVALINLIDKKGSQLRVGTSFTQTMEAINDPAFKYVWFDFHSECKKMKYENLGKLVALV